MLTTVLVLGLILLVVGFVAYPLLRRTSRAGSGLADESRDELLAQKKAVYEAIKDLEFDRAMGKLSPADYQEMVLKYKGQAVAILKALDKRDRTLPQLEEEMEREIARSRRDIEGEIEGAIAQARSKN